MKSITLPGSKSITNRNLILAALSDGQSILRSVLISDDTTNMIDALKIIGIKIENNKDFLIVHGGVNNIRGNDQTINVGESGTCMRFLIGLFLLNRNGSLTIIGKKSLNIRPVHDLLLGLKQMGIKFESNGNFPPVKIFPSKVIENKIKMNGNISSQFLTSLLQIAPLLQKGLEIEVIGDLVSKPYIDLTLNEINKFGVKIENLDYKKFIIKPQIYKKVDLFVEGDASSLSYIANFIVLHGGTIKINNIGNNTRQGDYKYLEKLKIFGLNYSSEKDITVIKSQGISNCYIEAIDEIDFEDMPDVSMSFMSLALFIKGKTKITGLQTLNLKESKRIDVMKKELEKIGVKIESDKKSIIIGELKQFPKNIIDIETYNDHRIAMVFGVLNTYIGNLNILNPDCVNKTYPKFWEDLKILQKL